MCIYICHLEDVLCQFVVRSAKLKANVKRLELCSTPSRPVLRSPHAPRKRFVLIVNVYLARKFIYVFVIAQTDLFMVETNCILCQSTMTAKEKTCEERNVELLYIYIYMTNIYVYVYVLYMNLHSNTK